MGVVFIFKIDINFIFMIQKQKKQSLTYIRLKTA